MVVHSKDEALMCKVFPSSSDMSSNDEKDDNYRRRSRTPLSKTFSYDEKHHHKCRNKSLPCKGLGNDTMSKALN